MKRTLSVVMVLSLAACGAPSGRGDGSDSRTVIQNKGSDTLVNVAQAWAENYREVQPNVAVAVTGGGSGTGVSAMIQWDGRSRQRQPRDERPRNPGSP